MGSYVLVRGFVLVDIVVCMIEKVNSLLNCLLEENKVFLFFGIVVIDEMYMIGDFYRGYLLELCLIKICYIFGCRG